MDPVGLGAKKNFKLPGNEIGFPRHWCGAVVNGTSVYSLLLPRSLLAFHCDPLQFKIKYFKMSVFK